MQCRPKVQDFCVNNHVSYKLLNDLLLKKKIVNLMLIKNKLVSILLLSVNVKREYWDAQ